MREIKLFFRHIRKSVRKSPWQSFIVLATVILSSVIFSCIPSFYTAFRTERDFITRLSYGKAELELTPSEGQYIGFGEVSKVICGTEAVSSGYFVVPASDTDGTVLAAASDFETVGNIFDFYFTEYGNVSEDNLNSTVFVTRSYAEKNGLKIGSAVRYSFLGAEKIYTVGGINEYPFFGGYDIIINCEGVLDTLSMISPVFWVFDTENFPCSKVFVHGCNGETAAMLSEEFNVSVCGEDSFYDELVFIILAAILFLSAVLGAVILGFSLEILGRRRSEENKSFLLIGMPPNSLFLFFCAEIFVYVAIGSIVGILLSGVFLVNISSFFEYAVPRLPLSSVLICVAFEFLIASVSLAIYKTVSKLRVRPRPKVRVVLAATALSFTLILTGLAHFLPFKMRIYFAFLAFSAFILTVIFGIPYFNILPKLIFARKRGSCFPYLSLAVKNNSRIKEIQNVYRVSCLVLSVSAVFSVCLSYFDRQMLGAKSFLNCDYAVIGSSDGILEETSALDGTEACGKAYFGEAKLSGGQKLIILDADEKFISDGYQNGVRPTGENAYLPENLAKLYGLKIGDDFEIEISGKSYILKLLDYSDIGSFVLFADSEYLGFEKNLTFIISDGRSAYSNTLSKNLSHYGAAVQSIDDLLTVRMHFASISKNLFQNYIVFLNFTVVLGVINLIAVSYFGRRRQFRELSLVGMSRAGITKMLLCEFVLIIIISTVLSYFGGALLRTLMELAMQSFGYSL